MKDLIVYNFYEKFHKNKINKILHIFGIPLIVWSYTFTS